MKKRVAALVEKAQSFVRGEMILQEEPQHAFAPGNIIDISLPLAEGMVTYPGNPEFQMETFVGPTSMHSTLSLGTHAGTHVDAPLHVVPGGEAIDTISLTACIGACRVLDMTHVEESITVSDVEACDIRQGERILVKTTNSARGYDAFIADYVYLDGNAAEYLASREIALFGIDYLSVKKRGGSDIRAHTALLEKGIVIFEGLQLHHVDPGEYTFIGLPLAIKGGDGAPARVVLVPQGQE